MTDASASVCLLIVTALAINKVFYKFADNNHLVAIKARSYMLS